MAEEFFEGLSAEYEDDIKPETDSVDLPNHVKTRPIIFRMLGGSGEMSAKTAGFRIVQALQEIAKEGDASSTTEVLIFMEGSHLAAPVNLTLRSLARYAGNGVVSRMPARLGHMCGAHHIRWTILCDGDLNSTFPNS